jgi:hypothetical protein
LSPHGKFRCFGCFGCFGGNLTVVGVEGLAWYRHERTVEADGIGRKFEERARELGAAAARVAGQGAGIAAAVSLRMGQELDHVDLCLVHAELGRQASAIGDRRARHPAAASSMNPTVATGVGLKPWPT